MKNSKLIEILKGFNLDADVTLTTSEDICISYISTDRESKKKTKQIFIEGCDFDERTL